MTQCMYARNHKRVLVSLEIGHNSETYRILVFTASQTVVKGPCSINERFGKQVFRQSVTVLRRVWFQLNLEPILFCISRKFFLRTERLVC